MKALTIQPSFDGSGLHIGIVCARFNDEITFASLDACLDELRELGVAEDNVLVVTVAGALEMGLALSAMASTDEFDALIGIGCVIRGETYHFEIVSNESAAAISRVSLETGIPIANGVLTCETVEQAEERAEEKGRDCAHVAVEMVNMLIDLQDIVPEDDVDDEEDLDDEDDEDDYLDDEDDDVELEEVDVIVRNKE